MTADASAAVRQVALGSAIQVLAMAPWFAGAVAEASPDRAASGGGLSLLTIAVQLGFVAGALALAGSRMADRVEPPTLIGAGALVACCTTALLAVGIGAVPSLVARLATGAALSAVYPPGIRVVISWSRRRRGAAVALLVGALTLGSSLPRLLAVGDAPSRSLVYLGSAACAAVAALLARGVRTGPYVTTPPKVTFAAASQVLRDRRQRKPIVGYVGHMWELYAFWSWLPLYLRPAELSFMVGDANLTAFTITGIAGFAGAIVGGLAADRFGRSSVATGALIASGSCCLVAPLLSMAPGFLATPILLFWGGAVIADSALFSAVLGDESPGSLVGTALCVQLALGFGASILSIWLLPVVAAFAGWENAMVVLVLGPILGVRAMRQGAREMLPRDESLSV